MTYTTLLTQCRLVDPSATLHDDSGLYVWLDLGRPWKANVDLTQGRVRVALPSGTVTAPTLREALDLLSFRRVEAAAAAKLDAMALNAAVRVLGDNEQTGDDHG